MTSYLLNGAGPETIGGDQVTNTATPVKTAQLVAGTDFSRPWTGDLSLSTDTVSASSAVVSATDTASSSPAAAAATASPSEADANYSSSGSTIKLTTPAIVGIVVGAVAIIAIIALILFLLARYKRAKDRQRLPKDSPDEKFDDSNPPTPKATGATTPTREAADNPFHDDKQDKNSALKRSISNPRRKQSDVTASFDFGGLVPTKKNYGKDGKPIIASVWDERDVGRPFSLSRIPSPSSTIAVVGDETPLDFVSKPKSNSPTKRGSGSSGGSGSSSDAMKADKTAPETQQHNIIKRKATPQERGLPNISSPISPFDDTNSLGDTPLRAAPVPMASTKSDSSIASTISSMTRKTRPAPIQVPPLRDAASRESIIIDKTVSPPSTLPPSIPTPPLPNLEFRKEWERIKRESSLSVESTDTDVLDEVAQENSEPTSATVVPAKTPLQPASENATNVPLPTRNVSTGKQIPRVTIAPLPKSPTNAGDILKQEKALLRVPSSTSPLSSSSSTSEGAGGLPPINKRTPSIVAATAKWAEKRKALNAVLAAQHNARAAKEKDPLPVDAVEKVQEARKSIASLAPSAELDDVPTKKREVEGRKNIPANTTESIGSPTLSVFKFYDPERESTFIPGEAVNLMRILGDEEDKENMPAVH